MAGRRPGPTRPLDRAQASAGVSVDEMLLAFWRHAEGHYRHPDGSPSKELDNIKVALRPLRVLYGPTPAKDFGPLALRAVRERMITDGLMRTTINGRVNRIRRAFRWAASVELVPVAVVQALATVRGSRKAGPRPRSPIRSGRSPSTSWRRRSRTCPDPWPGWSGSNSSPACVRARRARCGAGT